MIITQTHCSLLLNRWTAFLLMVELVVELHLRVGHGESAWRQILLVKCAMYEGNDHLAGGTHKFIYHLWLANLPMYALNLQDAPLTQILYLLRIGWCTRIILLKTAI